jgi:hypothetical protein
VFFFRIGSNIHLRLVAILCPCIVSGGSISPEKPTAHRHHHSCLGLYHNPRISKVFPIHTKKHKATVFHQKERNRREVQEGCAIDLTGGGGRWVNKQHQQPAAPSIREDQPQSVDLLVAEEAHLEEQVSGCSHTTQASRA